MFARSVLAILVSLTSACVWPSGDGRVFVSSDPPGAEVFVDGRPTGKTTPAELDLGGLLGSDHRIELRKAGYETETRTVTHFTRFDVSRWNEGVGDWSTPAFPTWWTIGDVLFPIAVRWIYVPHDLYVKLFPTGTFVRPDAPPAGGPTR